MKKSLLVLAALLLPVALSFAGGSGGKKTRQFAIVYPVIHPVFAPVDQGSEERAKEIGGITVKSYGPDVADPALQIQIVENLIAQKVDGIAIGPTDSAALTPLINRAIEKGIKVICFDTDAPQSKRSSYIGTISINFGHDMGEVLGKTLNGKGKVLVSQGVATQQNLIERLQGVKEVTSAKYPGIQYIDEQSGAGDPNKTLANIENMVKAHPDFDALIGICAACGPAAAIVWKAQGLKQPVIVGDDTDDIIKGVKEGYITYTIAQNQYIWGQKIVDFLNDLCDGKKVEEIYDAGTRAVDGKNVFTTAQYDKVSYDKK
jgi:ribose transport system substrate-binding protein